MQTRVQVISHVYYMCINAMQSCIYKSIDDEQLSCRNILHTYIFYGNNAILYCEGKELEWWFQCALSYILIRLIQVWYCSMIHAYIIPRVLLIIRSTCKLCKSTYRSFWLSKPTIHKTCMQDCSYCCISRPRLTQMSAIFTICLTYTLHMSLHLSWEYQK